LKQQWGVPHATNNKRGKGCRRYREMVDMHPLSSAIKRFEIRTAASILFPS
jgi:hypothetical protein